MSNPPSAPHASSPSSALGDQPVLGQVLRLFWMYLGSIVLLLVAAAVSKQPPWTYSWTDVFYGATVLGMIVARALDVLHFHGLTADEKPATPRHLVRYILLLSLFAGLLWVVAQSVQTG